MHRAQHCKVTPLRPIQILHKVLPSLWYLTTSSLQSSVANAWRFPCLWPAAASAPSWGPCHSNSMSTSTSISWEPILVAHTLAMWDLLGSTLTCTICLIEPQPEDAESNIVGPVLWPTEAWGGSPIHSKGPLCVSAHSPVCTVTEEGMLP